MPQDINILIIGALIGSLSPLLILLVTLYFQNNREVRARQWELEDRQWNRRRDVWGLRIKEAWDFVDMWHVLALMMKKLIREMQAEIEVDDIKHNLTIILENYTNLPSLMHETEKKGTSITILGNAELIELRVDLEKIGRLMVTKITEAAEGVLVKGALDVEKDKLKQLEEGVALTEAIMTEMKLKLDKLDQSVPQQ